MCVFFDISIRDYHFWPLSSMRILRQFWSRYNPCNMSRNIKVCPTDYSSAMDNTEGDEGSWKWSRKNNCIDTEKSTQLESRVKDSMTNDLSVIYSSCGIFVQFLSKKVGPLQLETINIRPRLSKENKLTFVHRSGYTNKWESDYLYCLRRWTCSSGVILLRAFG